MEYLSKCCGARAFGETLDVEANGAIGQCIKCNGNTVFYPKEE